MPKFRRQLPGQLGIPDHGGGAGHREANEPPDCGLGKVEKLEGATAKIGKVVKQNPKPGRVLVPGTKVKVTLGAAL